MLGVPGIQLGNYLAQSREMFLANAYLESSQFLQIDSVLSAPQIDLSACSDKKMVILYLYLCICTTKTRFYRTDAQIQKIERVCKGKTFAHRPMRICVSVYFLKKSQP
jgi:hypothetical protein